MARGQTKRVGKESRETPERERRKSLLKNLDFVLRGRSKSREMEWSDSYFILFF